MEIDGHRLERLDVPEIEKVVKAGRFLFLKEAEGVDDEVVKRKSKKKGKKSKQDEESSDESSDEESEESKSDSDESSSDSGSDSESESESESLSEEERRRKKGKGKKKEKSEVKTKKVKFVEEVRKETGKGSMDDIDKLSKRLHGLKVDDVEYMSTYTKLVALVPTLKGQIPPPAQWVMNMSRPYGMPQTPGYAPMMPPLPLPV